MLSIIGCGNTNRSDDGVGVYVARGIEARLKVEPVEGVRVFDAGTAGMEIMFQARGSNALIIVDASRSGSEPGAIFEVPGDELICENEPSYNLHDFRWQHALYAGRKIYKEDFPKEISVYLIEAENLDLGLSLSTKVTDAGDLVIEKIMAKLHYRASAI